MKKLFTAFLLMFVALAYGTVSGAGLLCGSAYAAGATPDGNGDTDGGGNGGPDDTSDDGGCGGGGSGDSGSGSDPDGSGGGTDF